MQAQPLSKPILGVMTALTFLTLLFGGMGVGGLGSDNATVALIGAWGTLVTGAANGAAAFYLANTNMPHARVVEFETDGTVYAGEANRRATGQEIRNIGADPLRGGDVR